MDYDRGHSFPFDFDSNEIQFSTGSLMTTEAEFSETRPLLKIPIQRIMRRRGEVTNRRGERERGEVTNSARANKLTSYMAQKKRHV